MGRLAVGRAAVESAAHGIASPRGAGPARTTDAPAGANARPLAFSQ